MSHIFVITSEPRLAESLERYYSHKPGHDFSSIVYSAQLRHEQPLKTFRWLTTQIESEVSEGGPVTKLRDAVGVLDFCDEDLSSIDDLNPISHNIGHWPVVASMLILAFPEIHWWLHTPYRFSEAPSLNEGHFLSASNLSGRHLLMLRQQGCCSLLDPLGLRNRIRKAITDVPSDDAPVASQIPLRSRLAVAIDEEEAHAHFNSYTAYRFGHRACPVTNRRTMQRTLGAEDGFLEPHLLLEDLYLGFPDRIQNPNRSLSNLKERDQAFSGLKSESVEHRVLITVGHRGTEEVRANWRKNRRHLLRLRHHAANRAETLKTRILYKPLGGVFDLWRKIGMWGVRWIWQGQPKTPKKFNWPPKPRNTPEGHSAPGRLLLIAEQLIGRSKAVLEEIRSVSDAIYAATLALEAKELLANRTPTTALEALALQHQAEVVAESRFHGIEFHLDVESRFRDIKKEVEAIGRWFSGRRRKRVTLNARLAIIEDLAREFSELDQFEEERKCRAEARRLYFDFWAYQSPWRLPFLPVLRYLSFSLRSLPAFLGLVVFWIFLFGVGYHLLDPILHVYDEQNFWEAFSSSTVYFFTLSTPDPYWGGGEIVDKMKAVWNSVLAIQGAISLSHLGLLVSHIYLILSRR